MSSCSQDGSLLAAPSTTRDHRLDALKGLAIILVLLWHLQPLANFWQSPIWLLSYTFNYEVALVGVPMFFLVSLMLLGPRVRRGANYLRRRVITLLTLTLIYFVLQCLVFVLVMHSWPHMDVHMLALVGPSLPLVGDSVFYFLGDLLILTLVGWLYFQVPESSRLPVGIMIVGISLFLFESSSFNLLVVPYYSPLNFVVYIPVADFVLRYPAQLARWFWLLVALYLICAAQDLLLDSALVWSVHAAHLAPYTRTSVALGALLLVVGAQRFSTPTLPWLELAGRYSLGLFALHKWAWYLIGGVIVPHLPAAGHYLHYVSPIGVATASVALTVVAVTWMSHTRLRFLVTGNSMTRQNMGPDHLERSDTSRRVQD